MSNLMDFAERISETPITIFQKCFLEKFEEAANNGQELHVILARCCGRRMIMDIIRQFENVNK